MLFVRKGNRRKSIFITILISYIAILLLPVITGTLLYKRVENIMAVNANQTHRGLLEQIKLVAEKRFEEVSHMTTQIAFNPKLQWSLSNFENDYSKNQFDYVEIMKDFKSMNQIGGFISDYFVYFKNTDAVLSPYGKSDAPFFFRKILTFNDKSPDWVMNDLLTGVQLQTYLPVTSIKEGERISHVITYVQSLPLGEKENVKGYLVVLIDEQEFDRLIEQFEEVNNGSIYIVDQNRQIIMSSAKEPALNVDVLDRLDRDTGYETFTLDGKEMMLTYTKGKNGWKYVSVVQKQIVLAQVISEKNFAITMLLLILAAGIVASSVMAYRNYSPIRDVVNMIMRENIRKREDSGNEFDYIKQSIIHTLGEKNEMKQTLIQQAPVIRANFLSRLIKGHVDQTALSEASLTFMGVHFRYAYFGVILLEIEDCLDFTREETEQEWVHVRFLLSGLIRDILGEQGDIVEMDRNRLAILQNVDTPTKLAYLEREAAIQNLHQTASRKFNLKISIAMSHYNQGVEHINRCYRQALIALDYRMIKGSDSVIDFGEIAGTEQTYYHYPIEDEAQLMNYAKNGDYTNAERLLGQIYEANFQSSSITPEMGKFLFIDLLKTIVKVMNSLHMTGSKPFESFIDPAKVIAESVTAEEMIQKTKEAYRTICNLTKDEKSENGDRLYHGICKYIDEHYADNGLSLATMADHFQISLQYLSTFFKKHSGVNVSDYIATIRIREAKHMLQDPNATMGEIAMRIGYANAGSFVRFFRKVEGVTPGKYREMLVRSQHQALNEMTSIKNGNAE